MFYSKLTIAALAGTVMGQSRPSSTPICDYYTTALLKDNTAANQATILTLLVNTVVIGNYTKPVIKGVTWPDITVPGILKEGKVDGESVNLLPYFDGSLKSSNRGGKSGVSVNFLDDGGATPLMDNKPANGTSSNQYKLLTHLYEFFGSLLGCTQQGMKGFDAYSGVASQYSVHKFMDLSDAQVTYFITQVGLAASSFGVAEADVTLVGTTLGKLFNYKCSPKTTVIKSQGEQFQSICTGDGCKKDPSAMGMCPAVEPTPSKSSGSSKTSGSASTSSTTGAAAHAGVSGGVVGLGLLAWLL